jgi:hypothetical protein
VILLCKITGASWRRPLQFLTKLPDKRQFIGEALDVTGMLGGYNLHWAWASAKMFIDGLDKK